MVNIKKKLMLVITLGLLSNVLLGMEGETGITPKNNNTVKLSEFWKNAEQYAHLSRQELQALKFEYDVGNKQLEEKLKFPTAPCGWRCVSRYTFKEGSDNIYTRMARSGWFFDKKFVLNYGNYMLDTGLTLDFEYSITPLSKVLISGAILGAFGAAAKSILKNWHPCTKS